MVWIKRNLAFVISAAVGAILMGWAGYFLWNGMSENSTASEEYKAAVSELQNLQNKAPFPSKDNIQVAKEQQEQVKAFLGEVKSSFGAFPAAVKTDEKGFKALLEKTIAQLEEGATNAGVGCPPQYAFSFSGIVTKLNFAAENIEPWTVQLQEIKSLCHFLYASKVNYLEGIRRVPVGPDDQGGADYLNALSLTNETCIRTPYELTFRGFSVEVAALLEGLQKATNCYVVKNIDVQPASPSAQNQPAASFEMQAPAPIIAPRPTRGPGGALVAAPVTILSEKPLHVTLLVEVIKLKTP